MFLYHLALLLKLSHERTQQLIRFQHYHVTQRLVGTYSVGSKTKSIRPRPKLRLVWDRSCCKTVVSEPKTDNNTESWTTITEIYILCIRHINLSNSNPWERATNRLILFLNFKHSIRVEWLEKAGRTSSHLLAGHYEEWPIIPQPQCGRCHRAGTGQAIPEITGSMPIFKSISPIHWIGASQIMIIMMN